MTDARDDLAELIHERCWPRWKYPETPESIADAILAAGWRAPATSTCDHLWEWLNVKNDLATCYRCGEQEYRSP